MQGPELNRGRQLNRGRHALFRKHEREAIPTCRFSLPGAHHPSSIRLFAQWGLSLYVPKGWYLFHVPPVNAKQKLLKRPFCLLLGPDCSMATVASCLCLDVSCAVVGWGFSCVCIQHTLIKTTITRKSSSPCPSPFF